MLHGFIAQAGFCCPVAVAQSQQAILEDNLMQL